MILKIMQWNGFFFTFEITKKGKFQKKIQNGLRVFSSNRQRATLMNVKYFYLLLLSHDFRWC